MDGGTAVATIATRDEEKKRAQTGAQGVQKDAITQGR